MARGWESKSVEDQIAASRDEGEKAGPDLTEAERTRRQRAAALQVARSRILQQLQGACDRRYRAQLEQSLAAVEAELERTL
jgi:hypothetical protein